jgi:chaperone required for assembly of F1-ATPase
MKRFYREAAAAAAQGGCAILLDGRPVRTPARNPLVVPSEALAKAVAEEWNAQGEKVEPLSMPITGLANVAIDRVAPDPAAFASRLAAYGESDLLCYRAEGPESLVRRQQEVWDPILAWARRRFDIDFELVCGVIHRPQPARTVEQLGKAVAARTLFELAALSPLVTISGSLVVALAIAEREIGLEDAWAAGILDEAWQAEQWGADPLAASSLESRRRAFEAASRFLTLL